MSSVTEEIDAHIDYVDVNSFKENVTLFELQSDSGIDNADTCSSAYPLSSDSDLSPIKSSSSSKIINNLTNDLCIKNESLASPISPDNQHDDLIMSNRTSSDDSTTNISKENDLEVNNTLETKNDFNSDNSDLNLNTKAFSASITSLDNKNITETLSHTDKDINTNFSKEQEEKSEMIEKDVPCTQLNLNNTLATSTISLQEQDCTQSKERELIGTMEKIDKHGSCTQLNLNNTLTTSTTSLHEKCDIVPKSTISRSAENISNINDKQEINTDEILAQFSSHKNKVGATQKIPETQSIDRYGRIPKEILSQDIGSIVKNVHGIFSSVSGSLKSAYNTHRVYPQKVPLKKPVPNGKVMKEIFEDEVEINTEKNDIPNLEESETKDELSETKDVLKLQVEALEKLQTLEKVLGEQRKENVSLRDRVKQHLDELQEKDSSFREMEVKFDMMSKRVEQAEREKDAAVMRYASVECQAIEARRLADKAAQAERSAVSEMELLGSKLKSAHGEKQRICQLYDNKCHELSVSEREVAKVREELRELEGRLKWTQSKLRVEMDAYKESSERAEKLAQQVTELEASKEAAVANAADSIRAKQLESELKECRAALILCRHEKEELDRKLTTNTQQLDTCRRERDNATSALARTADEVEKLKESNLRLEEEAAELAALRAQAALADTLSAQLHRETERAQQAEEALSSSAARAETCARREAAALEHAAKLTTRHVTERDAAEQAYGKVQALTADNNSLRERITSLEAETARLHSALNEETERRNKENRVLARKVAELTEEVEEANKKLEWEKGENGVLKKKHSSAIKELNRELQRALKRCEQLEAKLPTDAPSTRTGSISSLSSGESAQVEERLQNGHVDNIPDIQVREPDRQTLIERIVSLQRAAARRAERCEFLEEHSKQLTSELRSKSRLLRHLLCTLPAGAVASQDRDMNKKEMARLGGGAMAAVWGGDSAGMTIELSLEMNRRLQAVLEDTLLKNITLKENMDTLGAEISKLKEQRNSEPK